MATIKDGVNAAIFSIVQSRAEAEQAPMNLTADEINLIAETVEQYISMAKE